MLSFTNSIISIVILSYFLYKLNKTFDLTIVNSIFLLLSIGDTLYLL
nr:MAG TPA: hypothetical protein [Caudoviricetes sp.]